MFSASKSGQYPGYQISRSVRLRSSASAYLTRTMTTPTSATKWSWSGWVKRGTLPAAGSAIFAGFGAAANQDCYITFGGSSMGGSADQIGLFSPPAGNNISIFSSAVYRDPSAWYHVVVSVDTTQGTAANRVRIYVNGTEITYSGTPTYPTASQALNINSARAHYISGNSNAVGYFDGYLTEINFIDGQTLTPSSFGVTNAYGVWSPIKYNGTYGTNGFYLNFSDNSGATATTIGKDSSGNGNNWTPNNISVTAGVTYDSMLDVPTPWGDGGNGRGNYCVVNPLNYVSAAAAPTFSNGNLRMTGPSSVGASVGFGSIGMSSGKWYWEATMAGGVASSYIGIAQTPTYNVNSDLGYTANDYAYRVDTGQKRTNNTNTAYAAACTSTDTIGIAFDVDSGTLTIYKNGSSLGTMFSGISDGTYVPGFDTYNGQYYDANFGQRPFAYTPPSGFRALNTFNLPEPSIDNGRLYMAATTYTGNASTLVVTNTNNGFSFQPDFVWIKDRTTALNHRLLDAVRGTTSLLYSNLTDAQATIPNANDTFTSFNSNGFTLGVGQGMNANGDAYVAWQWNAGGSNATNTSGSITSTVRASTTSGFSVVTYTGTGANATVGHGLGVAPSMVIVKRRDSTGNWQVRHTSIAAANSIQLNLTSAAAAAATVWNSTAPTSTVFSIGTSTDVNANTGTYVAYCFASITGYSAFGSYTGNGSTNGPFVYTGFRPAFVMIKSSSSAGGNWLIQNNKTLGYNPSNSELYANLSNAETTADRTDLLSNGFKPRINSAENNSSGVTYIYAAFAENPFKYSLAR